MVLVLVLSAMHAWAISPVLYSLPNPLGVSSAAFCSRRKIKMRCDNEEKKEEDMNQGHTYAKQHTPDGVQGIETPRKGTGGGGEGREGNGEGGKGNSTQESDKRRCVPAELRAPSITRTGAHKLTN